MRFLKPPKIRREGLAIGIELGDSEYVSIGERCRKRGLLVSVEDDPIALFPALNIEADLARKRLDILEESV